MNLAWATIFFLACFASLALLIGGLHYYLRTREDALGRRLEELQERSMGAGAGHSHAAEDIWDFFLQATFGVIFGRSWFRQKEMELVRAGIRRPYAVKVYGMLSLILTALLLLTAYLLFSGGDTFVFIFALIAAIVLGYFIPEQVLLSLRRRHRLNLQAALPDTTDMLSIVLGAGLSLDQAIARVSDELRFVYPELADEFYWMTLEVQAGQERSVAFQHMAKRTGLMDLRSLASMIVQAERFGTGLAQGLRIYADSLRTRRRLDIEATINKAGVKMVFPIVLFILPALFVVIMVPGVLSILRDLQSLR
jgi:tight adherence protein C